MIFYILRQYKPGVAAGVYSLIFEMKIMKEILA